MSEDSSVSFRWVESRLVPFINLSRWLRRLISSFDKSCKVFNFKDTATRVCMSLLISQSPGRKNYTSENVLWLLSKLINRIKILKEGLWYDKSAFCELFGMLFLCGKREVANDPSLSKGALKQYYRGLFSPCNF